MIRTAFVRLSQHVALVGLLTVVGLSFSTDAHACQACACGDATFAVRPSDPNTHLITAQLLASHRGERYGEGLPWQFREWRTDLTLGWAYQRTTVSLRLPWVWRTLDHEGLRTNRTAGIGDIEVAGSYVFTKRPSEDASFEALARARRTYAAVHFGLSVPTAQLAVDVDGEPIIDDVQSGTGSFTPYAGINWSVGLKGFRLDGRHTLYVPIAGRFSFRVGPTLQQRVRLMAEPFEVFRFGVAAYGSLSAPVTHDGEAEDDTGGFIGYLDLEAEVQPHEQLMLFVGARMPVIQALRGHHRADPSVYFGVRFQQAIRPRSEAPAPDLYL